MLRVHQMFSGSPGCSDCQFLPAPAWERSGTTSCTAVWQTSFKPWPGLSTPVRTPTIFLRVLILLPVLLRSLSKFRWEMVTSSRPGQGNCTSGTLPQKPDVSQRVGSTFWPAAGIQISKYPAFMQLSCVCRSWCRQHLGCHPLFPVSTSVSSGFACDRQYREERLVIYVWSQMCSKSSALSLFQ